MTNIKACIFDLDGVITDTSHFHFLGWKRLAETLGIELDETANENLKGVSRMESLEWILDKGGVRLSQEKKNKLAAEKNEWYLEYIQNISPSDLFPGVESFLFECKEMGLGISLGSSSKNAQFVVEKLGIRDAFDCMIDGTHVTRSKPAPDIFLKGAECLGVRPESCIVFEDAISGIEAALNAGMIAVGVGDPKILSAANMVISGLEGHHPKELINQLKTALDLNP
jgi:beta-phosphoglucomutase